MNNFDFMYDICRCASSECPKYENCWRGNGQKKNGIYTISYLAEICNNDNNYEMFIGDKK